MQQHKAKTTFIRLPEVKLRVGLCRSSIYAFIARGDFPRPYSLGGRAVAWLESEIDGWIELRLQEGQSRNAA